jgi:hypothetical protein
MAKIRQRTLNSHVAPTSVFARQTDDQFFDFLYVPRSTGAAGTSVILIRDQFPVPSPYSGMTVFRASRNSTTLVV